MNACLLYFQFPGEHARFPATSRELHLVVALAAVGFLLAVCLIRPLLEAIQFLDRRKRPRAAGGGHLDRIADLHPLALRGRDLRGLDLAGSFLVDTDLSYADLRGVDFSGADLENVCLWGAIYDASTRWPEGFDPRHLGAIKA